MSHASDIYKKEISLVDFARLEYGYQINRKKSSQRQFVLEKEKGNDKIIVSRNQQGQYWYFNPFIEKDKGTIIDFVLNRGTKELEEVWEILSAYMTKNEKNADTLSIPVLRPDLSFNLSPLSDFYYLEKRGISIKTIFSKEFKERIFNFPFKSGENTYVNIAFPIYKNNEVIGLELKNQHYNGYAKGSLKSQGIWVSNYMNLPQNEEVEFVICESAIDCLSYQQLFPTQVNRIYLSTGGVLTELQMMEIQNIIALFSQPIVVLANDNDIAGVKQNIQLIGAIELNPKSKRIKSLIKPLNQQFLSLDIQIRVGEIDLEFEVKSIAQIFLKDKTLNLEANDIQISFHQGWAQIRLPINIELLILRRIETILPLIKGIKNNVKVQKPQNKDFNEDLLKH